MYSITINEKYLCTNKHQNKLYFRHIDIIVENDESIINEF